MAKKVHQLKRVTMINEKTLRQSNKNPAPSKTEDKLHASDSRAEQDDTGGPNNSGERSDDN